MPVLCLDIYFLWNGLLSKSGSNQQCVGTGDSLSSVGAACDNNIHIKGVVSLVLILMVNATFFLAVGMTLWQVYELYLAKSASKYIRESKKWFEVKDQAKKIL